MKDHSCASCDDPLCGRCEGYSAGYVDGKSKALFEVSPQTSGHPAGCGCDPCQAVAERLRRREDSPREGHDRESGHDRGSLTAGLQTEIALILGIDLLDEGLL